MFVIGMEEQYTVKEHLIRSYDVMVLGIAYLIFGLASSYVINRFSSTAHPSDSKTKLILEIGAEVAVTVLFSYFIHVIIERMPLPMAGTTEIKQQIIKQVRGGIVIAFAMFTLQVKLRNKILYLFYGKADGYLVGLDG
uniref:Uncharacterized protein n=1 Tax=Marseillevirus LCMAC202 TaxID=2506606 RepID=A0A481YY91_9VIRU|nr:MAG: hypothetical protein LCMAC202_05850 [Marseillevirus LCMAC202]